MTTATITGTWKKVLSKDFDPKTEWNLVEDIQAAALKSNEPATVNFGTSGWRGEIGSEFTLRNVQVVAKAMIKMYKEADAALWEHLGINSFEELQKRGLIIGHDNRMLGEDFCRVAANEFLKEGVKVLFAGEASTPEYSAAVEMLEAACAINMTPSHNPADYAGIKFNPADGGPAGSEITSVITANANKMMADHQFEFPGDVAWETFDILKVYKEYLIKKGTIDFATIEAFLTSGKVALVTDHVHGSTRGRPGYILNDPACLTTIKTDDNVLFGGIAPEPSSANLAEVKEVLAGKDTELKLGVIFDPDGDRIRFYDGEIEIDMNRFGAMAFHYLATVRKIKGCVAKSVATSNFVNIIAEKLGVELKETAVGFKNFRPYNKVDANPRSLISFEESDGISGYNNTIEKDAQFGLLIALEMMAKTGKSLGRYLKDLQEEYGYFYPERFGFEVDKSLVGAPLVAQVNAVAAKAPVGSTVAVGAEDKKVKQLVTLDGVKIIFEDDSWMLIRPSGTEPKVRIYAECRKEEEKEAMFEGAKKLFFE
ncbi:MAG: phosphomannomutase [Fibrobacterales bacterium]